MSLRYIFSNEGGLGSPVIGVSVMKDSLSYHVLKCFGI